MFLRGLRARFGPPPPDTVFGLRVMGLQAILIGLFTLVSVFQVIPAYVTVVLTLAIGVWFIFFTKHYDRTKTKITQDGWENFLDGREELGEYEELGGQYEPAGPDADADTDEDDDR